MKYPVILVMCLCVFQGFSQKNVNNYKYIIVPEQFGFQNEANQFRLNQLTKFLLKKHGFEAYLEGEELPRDLENNICLALKTSVEIKGALKTKARVKLLDCYDNLVFVTQEGVSREKEFSKAYNLAIRDAFKGFESLNYKFIPKDNSQVKEAKVREAIKPKIETPAKTKTQDTKKIEANNFPVAPEKSSRNTLEGFPNYKRDGKNFYLKPGFGGTYMVDKNNTTVFKLQDTSKDNVYIVTINNLIGVAFFNVEEDFFTLEYYNSNKEREIEIYRLAQ